MSPQADSRLAKLLRPHAPGRRRLALAQAAAIAALLWLAAGAAAAQSIQATADRTRVAVGDQIVFSITVVGADGARPELPDLRAFEVMAGGEQKQWNFINGRSSSSVTYNFILLPQQVGHFVVGPVTIEVDSKVLASRPFTIEVVAATEPAVDERQLFLTATVSTETPYVGQQVLWVWRFYRRVQVAEPRLEQLEFDGFLIEDLGDVREFETVVAGQRYAVSELRKALFPQEAGALTIPASKLSCRVIVNDPRRRGSVFDDAFGRRATRAQVLTTPAITLAVRELPPAPPGFSGLVGEFSLTTSISASEAAVGESLTLVLVVSGSGNAQSIPPPIGPELDAFRVYDDQPVASIERSADGLSGRRTFRKALVPRQPGRIELEPARLVYFDPAAGEYRTRRATPLALTIRPSENPEELLLTETVAPGAGKVSVRILADDILPLYRELDALDPAGPPPEWILALLLAPAALFGAVWATVSRQRRFAADPALVRRRRALARARSRLRELEGVAAPNGAAESASLCLRCFVGDKLDLEGAALTPSEAATALRRRGAGTEIAAQVEGLLERLDAARFGAGQLTAAGLRQEIETLLPRLDRELR